MISTIFRKKQTVPVSSLTTGDVFIDNKSRVYIVSGQKALDGIPCTLLAKPNEAGSTGLGLPLDVPKDLEVELVTSVDFHTGG